MATCIPYKWILHDLTVIITRTGTTNPHVAPFSVSIQQLCITIGYKDKNVCEYNRNTYKSSCPY